MTVTVEETAAGDDRLAKARGYQQIKLETGVRQPAAIVVYERAGFTRIPTYAPYDQWDISVCFAKTVSEHPIAARSA